MKLDKLGYIDSLESGETYSEAKEFVRAVHRELKADITAKEEVLSQLKMRLATIEYNDRTLWLLFDKDGNQKDQR